MKKQHLKMASGLVLHGRCIIIVDGIFINCAKPGYTSVSAKREKAAAQA
jgi:hypothetical protein